jgi:hypothetical protein
MKRRCNLSNALLVVKTKDFVTSSGFSTFYVIRVKDCPEAEGKEEYFKSIVDCLKNRGKLDNKQCHLLVANGDFNCTEKELVKINDFYDDFNYFYEVYMDKIRKVSNDFFEFYREFCEENKDL